MGDAIVRHALDEDASTQFLVEVGQPVEVFAGFGIDFLVEKFGHISQGFHVLGAIALHQYLMGNDVFATKSYRILECLGDGQRIGDDIPLATKEHLYKFFRVLGCFHFEIQAERLGELLGQFVLISHRYAPIIEVGDGAVQG